MKELAEIAGLSIARKLKKHTSLNPAMQIPPQAVFVSGILYSKEIIFPLAIPA
jgi:hypothetical protein